ncbi:Molybdate transporter 2 [Linum grandiflorum]
MPAQPMKSIAAVAVSVTPHLTASQIAAAGISTATTLLFLGATGIMSLIYRYLPLPVVRAQLRLLRDQVHPIQSGFPLFQIHHSQILARPRRNTARPLRHPLPRPHHWLRLRHEYLQRGDLPISPSAASG